MDNVINPGAGLRIGLSIFLLLTMLVMAFQASGVEPVHPGYTEVVTRITKAMPAGVAVDKESRVYISFPNWGSTPPYALARLGRDNRLIPFPSTHGSKYDEATPKALDSVLGIRIDQKDRLWVLDNARPRFEPAHPGAIKLVAYDCRSGREVHRFIFPRSVADPNRAFLNDLVIDNKSDTVYISDMSTDGHGAIIVYDQQSDKAWRVLDGNPALSAENSVIFIDHKHIPLNGGVDGIALSSDGNWLYWKALAGRTLYRIQTNVLRNRALNDSQRATLIENLGDAPITDGMLADKRGDIYFTSLEQSSVVVRRPTGQYRALSSDSHIVWPDSMELAGNGWLYLVSNQVNRMPLFNEGKDLRKPPYFLLRIWTGIL